MEVGAVWLVFDPDNPKIVYAGRVYQRRVDAAAVGGGGRGAPPVTTPATESQIYRSTDEGVTWKKTSPNGLPGGNFGTISLAVAPGLTASASTTTSRRASSVPTMAASIGRAPATIPRDRRRPVPRHHGGSARRQILFATQTSLYRSTDAGKTWESYTGAPSGADFNYVWIDPTNDKNMILAVDQGTEISMDAGRTWTTWFNQPTGQMYNVTTDHGFRSSCTRRSRIAAPSLRRSPDAAARSPIATGIRRTASRPRGSGRPRRPELSLRHRLVRLDSARHVDGMQKAFARAREEIAR